MNKSYFSNFVVISLWFSSALAILIRVYSLRFNPPESAVLFWLPYIILVSVSAMMVSTKKGLFPLFVALGVSLVLHILNFLREPAGLIWNTDPSHNLQIATSIVRTGYLAMGDPSFTSIALGSSYYPGLELFMSSLHMITGIPLMTLYKCAFAIINVITLLSLFLLMKLIVKDQRTINLCIFLYALCPGFSFDSFGVHEALGIILYPLIMSVFLINVPATHKFRSRKVFTVILIFMLLITITHHFTMYMLVLNAFLITIGTYIFKRKTYTPQTRILVLLIILVASWIIFNAFYFVLVHGEVSIRMIRGIFLGSEFTRPMHRVYSLSLFARIVSYAGIGLFLLTSLIGAYIVGWRKEKYYIKNAENSVLMLWWVISVALMGLFEIVKFSGARYRATEFAYFGIVLFSAIGIKKIGSTRLGYLNKIITIGILIIIAVPTIYLGFTQQGYLCYDNPPPVTIDCVYPVESYFSSIWLKTYSKSNYVLGTSDGYVYISAYASKKYEYSLFADSVDNRLLPLYMFYVNRANLMLPDAYNFTLKTEDLVWLTSNLNVIYDNGIIGLLLTPKMPW